jgi:hypothetical protein
MADKSRGAEGDRVRVGLQEQGLAYPGMDPARSLRAGRAYEQLYQMGYRLSGMYAPGSEKRAEYDRVRAEQDAGTSPQPTDRDDSYDALNERLDQLGRRQPATAEQRDYLTSSMEEMGLRQKEENVRHGQMVDTLERKQNAASQLNPGIGSANYLSPMQRRQVVAGEMSQDRRQYQLLRRAYQGYARQGRGRRGDPEANLRAASVLGAARDSGLNLSAAYNTRTREAEVRDQLSGAWRESLGQDIEARKTQQFRARLW